MSFGLTIADDVVAAAWLGGLSADPLLAKERPHDKDLIGMGASGQYPVGGSGQYLVGGGGGVPGDRYIHRVSNPSRLPKWSILAGVAMALSTEMAANNLSMTATFSEVIRCV